MKNQDRNKRISGWAGCWLDAILVIALVVLMAAVIARLFADAGGGAGVSPQVVGYTESLLDQQLAAADDPNSWMIPYLAGSGGAISIPGYTPYCNPFLCACPAPIFGVVLPHVCP